MKNRLSRFGIIIVLSLLLVNVFLFASSLRIEDEIGRLERQTSKLGVDNLNLRAKLSGLTSLKYVSSVAKKLNFKEPQYAALAPRYE